MRNEILAALPELNLIQDAGLRDQVIAVWTESLETGGFLRGGDEAGAVRAARRPAQHHAPRACAGGLPHVRGHRGFPAASYGKRLTINRDVLVAGALLADVGKFLEYERRKDGTLRKAPRGELLRHPFTGVGLAFRQGLPLEVMHIIAVHSKEGDHVRRSTEAVIYHHADFTNFELVR
jgi:hypothetical protein